MGLFQSVKTIVNSAVYVLSAKVNPCHFLLIVIQVKKWETILGKEKKASTVLGRN